MKATTKKQPDVKAETKALAIRAKPFEGLLLIKSDTRLAELQLTDVRMSLGAVKELRKELEAKRKSYVDPLNTVVKKINANCKEVDAPLAKLEEHGKGLVIYNLQVQQAEELAKVERQAKAAERKGDTQFAEDLRTNAVTSVSVAGNGVATRSIYKARVTDITALLSALNKLDVTIRDALLVGFTEVIEKVYGGLARTRKTVGLLGPGVEAVEEKVVAVSV